MTDGDSLWAVVAAGDLTAVHPMADWMMEAGDQRGILLFRRWKAWAAGREKAVALDVEYTGQVERYAAEYPALIVRYRHDLGIYIFAMQSRAMTRLDYDRECVEYQHAFDNWKSRQPSLIGRVWRAITGERMEPPPIKPTRPAALQVPPPVRPTVPDRPVDPDCDIAPGYVAQYDEAFRDYVRRLVCTPPGSPRVRTHVPRGDRPVWA